MPEPNDTAAENARRMQNAAGGLYRLDPVSEAIGELRADVRNLRAAIYGLYLLTSLGFTALGWLVTHRG